MDEIKNNEDIKSMYASFASTAADLLSTHQEKIIDMGKMLDTTVDATKEMYKDLLEVRENQLKIMMALNELRHASIKASRASLISLAVASASFIVMALHLLGYF